jgi:parallel beta-helix repeat protein
MLIRDNRVWSSNTHACTPGTPTAGIAGIATAGATNTNVVDNNVVGNPNHGIAVLNAQLVGEANVAPTGDTVVDNHVVRNRGGDLFWDGTGSVVFHGNDCATWSPVIPNRPCSDR